MPSGLHVLIFQIVWIRGHSSIKVTGGPTLRFLARAVQQLKMKPRADTKSDSFHPTADTIPHFNSPREETGMTKL